MMPALLSVIVAFSIFALAGAQVALTNLSVSGRNVDSQQALNIAEAGLNYYKWHLNHSPNDYKDGKTTPATPDPQLGYGPYQHTFIDKDGTVGGTFTLWIKPPTGSTVATVRSIGREAGSNVMRTVEAQIGAASFASYGIVADSELWIGATEIADGPVHSNVGVHMDGTNTSTVSSANASYIPTTQYGGNGVTTQPGVWCSPSVTTPLDCTTRSKANWVYPVTAIDFNQVTNSLCNIKKAAFAANTSTASLANGANACTQTPNTRTNTYLPQRKNGYNLTEGYFIQVNSNNTYSIFNVNDENDQAADYTTALSRTLVQANIPIPASGVLYVEDNVWVRTEGKFNGRLTIASGKLTGNNANSYANIVIVDDIEYQNKNGSNAIGLVSQDSVIIAPYAPPATGSFTFEVNAAILAQTGNVWYPSVYRSNKNKCTRGWTAPNQRLNYYGSIAVRQVWTWSWLQGSSPCGDAAFASGKGYVSGFLYNTTSYDYNLKYGPPPSYPTISGYSFLSWREVLTRP